MGNFDFSKCYECKYCYEAIEEKSHELIKKEETDYNANTAIQSLGEKPEPESLPIESTTKKKNAMQLIKMLLCLRKIRILIIKIIIILK